MWRVRVGGARVRVRWGYEGQWGLSESGARVGVKVGACVTKVEIIAYPATPWVSACLIFAAASPFNMLLSLPQHWPYKR